MKVVFIVNKQAGGGKGEKVWRQYQRKLNIPYTIHCTNYAQHAIDLARQYTLKTDEHHLLIAVGGDGTAHEVIEGAAGYGHITIGVLKAGSGNDFARGYTVFQSIAQLEGFIHNYDSDQTSNLMDLGRITAGKVKASFVNNAGIGFDALVTSTVNTSTVKRLLNMVKLGSLAYLLITIWALFSFKPFDVTIRKGQQKFLYRKVWFVAMSNQPYFGGGMKISPHSVPNDQQLELTVVHQLSKIKLLFVFLTVFWGKHERFKEVSLLTGDSFDIRINSPVVAHVDGEGLGLIHPNQAISCQLDERKWTIAS